MYMHYLSACRIALGQLQKVSAKGVVQCYKEEVFFFFSSLFYWWKYRSADVQAPWSNKHIKH